MSVYVENEINEMGGGAMKHKENLVVGFYASKSGKEYKVVADKYSGNDYRVVEVSDEAVKHIVGKSLQNGHRFRRARKEEL